MSCALSKLGAAPASTDVIRRSPSIRRSWSLALRPTVMTLISAPSTVRGAMWSRAMRTGRAGARQQGRRSGAGDAGGEVGDHRGHALGVGPGVLRRLAGAAQLR